jgi:ABC-type iron transport system FetAB ATPase subunit
MGSRESGNDCQRLKGTHRAILTLMFGPSRCGKSTSLRLLAVLPSPRIQEILHSAIVTTMQLGCYGCFASPIGHVAVVWCAALCGPDLVLW